jgi:hypothetical protein
MIWILLACYIWAALTTGALLSRIEIMRFMPIVCAWAMLLWPVTGMVAAVITMGERWQQGARPPDDLPPCSG